MWASCNLGASSPQESGGYYAWGEVEEKNEYCLENYLHIGVAIFEISGTKYDVVNKKLGENYRIPTRQEFKELMDECTWVNYEFSGVKGQLVTGKNGNSIFIPGVGIKQGLENSRVNSYWTSTANEHSRPFVLNLSSYSGPYFHNYSSYKGLPIRPVKSRR